MSNPSDDEYGIKSFPSDNSKLAEMEFYLVDDLECDLIAFHPYRTLMTLCGREGSSVSHDTEAGELGAGVQDGPRYWGTGEGKLELQESALQMAWYEYSLICSMMKPHTSSQVHHKRHIPVGFVPDIPASFNRHCCHLPNTCLP